MGKGLKYYVRKVNWQLNTGDVEGYKAEMETLNVIKEKELLERIATTTNVPKSMIKACTLAMVEAIRFYVINGHRVEFDSFGKFHLKVDCKCVDTPEECVAETVTRTQLCFTPNAEMKQMLSQISLEKDDFVSVK